MYPVHNNAFAIIRENKPMHMETHSACAYVKLTTKHYSMSCHANMNLIHEQNIQSNMKSLVSDSVCGVRWPGPSGITLEVSRHGSGRRDDLVSAYDAI